MKIVNEEVGWLGEACDRQTNEMVTTAQSLPFSPSPSQRPDLPGNQNQLNTGLRDGWRKFDFLSIFASIFGSLKTEEMDEREFLGLQTLKDLNRLNSLLVLLKEEHSCTNGVLAIFCRWH